MRRLVMSALLLVTSVLGGAVIATAPAVAASTGTTAALSGKIVSEEPARTTPNILDGTVYSITQVGNTIVVGGQFSQVENANSTTVITRNNVFAFDATSGQVTPFAPNPNSTVYKVQAAADGTSVYLGGQFTSVTSEGAATAVKYLYEADASTGTRIASFAPVLTSAGSTVNFTPQVRDLEVTGTRLWVAGKFTKVNNATSVGLASINAISGASDGFLTSTLSGLHNSSVAGSVTDVLQISTNASNTKLVAVGNFTAVDGAARSQIAMFDISGASSTLSGWSTGLYASACSSKFDTYMSDVEFSPDGTFFVVSTTGAWGGTTSSNTGNGCDVVARFETSATGTAVAPTWAAYTGGDTTWTIEVTNNVIYAGGHMRWQNNPEANGTGDAAGRGSVARTGIAALDPVNGMAYSWNPTRSRGVGVQDMMATSQGLYVGSDTTLIGPTDGNRYHARMALLPLAGGKTLPTVTATSLPADVYTVATGGSQLVRRTFTGGTVASSTNAPNGAVAWGSTVGAFMVNGILYTASSNGTLSRQTFDGTTYGAATTVATADQIVPQSDWHGTDVPALTSLFYSGGRIYYTMSGTGNTGLYSRGFEVEDDIVGQLKYTTKVATGNVTYAGVRGAFVAGSKMYYADTTGKLFSATWSGTAPVGGTLTQVSGPGKDAQSWAARAMFTYQAAPVPVNQAPTASLKVRCSALTCTYDGSASTDEDGTIASYDWNFGDGSTHGSGATTTHTYAAAGDNTVTLKVTDNAGASGSTTGIASANATASRISYVGGASTAGNRTAHTVTIPSTVQAGDTLVLFFVGNLSTTTYTGPAGWTKLQDVVGNTTDGLAFTKQAVATDAGKSVTVTSAVAAKDAITVAAYRGTDAATPVVSSGSITEDDPSASHTTPPLVSPNGRSWLLSYWADKSAATTKITVPSGQTARSSATGTTSGHVTGQLADSGGTVNTGANGGLTATADSVSARGVTFSVLLAPAAPNNPPVSRATVSTCVDLSCTFDGSTSSDADGDAITYDWDFGDSTHSSAISPTHPFATSGAHQVTLTVTDTSGATGTSTVTANPTAPPANAAPVAHATVTACTSLTCSFDASASTDPDGDAITYDWSFGDGTTHSSQIAPSHDYTTGGDHPVVLTVTDSHGATGTDTVTATTTAPPVNQAPVAHATLTGCTNLTCSFDASTSTDPDGDAITYDWDFGDGTAHSSQIAPSHDYATSGGRTVSLTVTDSHGATGTDTVTATPTDPQTVDHLSYVGGASTQGNRTAHSVVIPSGVQAGDTLVLFFTGNTTTPTYTGPTGWTQIEAQDGSGTAGRAYTRTAVATDAGKTVTVTSSVAANDVTTLAAYRGADPTKPVAVSASALQATSSTVHTTPTVTAADGRSWLVSYWADKGSSTTTLTGPAGQTARSGATGSSSGHITGLLADSAGTVASGTRGGLSATGDAAGSSAVTFSILIAGS
ncbi:MAG: PKD domain-containing protein [Nocardioidaceae bacterium]